MRDFGAFSFTLSRIAVLAALALAPAAVSAGDNGPVVSLKSGDVKLRSIVKGTPQKLGGENQEGSHASTRGLRSVAPAIPPSGTHVILHFERRLREKDYDALAARGVHVWNYMEANVYTATVNHDDTDKLLDATKDIDKVTSFEIIGDKHKVDRSLSAPTDAQARARSIKPDGTREAASQPDVLAVELWPDADFEQAKAELGALGKIEHSNEYTKRLDIRLASPNLLSTLSASRYVKYVAPKHTPAIQNTHIRRSMGVDAVQNADPGLTGANVKVAVFDQGHVAKDHPSFAGRLHFDPQGDEGTHYSAQPHATHVAGTIAGNGDYKPRLTSSLGEPISEQSLPAFGDLELSGNSVTPADLYTEKRYPGIAPAAEIVSYDFNDASSKLIKVLIGSPQSIDLASNSWAASVEDNCQDFGSYTLGAQDYDRITSGHAGATPIKRIPVVFAAGNYRSQHIDRSHGASSNKPMVCGLSPVPPYVNYYTITPPSTAKNVITVGAVNADDNSITDFSDYGPTKDGRIKPEVVAPGCRVPGIVSDIPADSIGLFCGTSQAAPAVSGTIALMMQKLQSTGVAKEGVYPSTYKALIIHAAEDLGAPGPDYASGYGRVRVPETIALIAGRHFSQGQVEREGETILQHVQVPANAKEIKVTLVWDDPPRDSIGNGGLVNDLDLSLKSPSQQVVLPWILNPARGREGDPATRGADHVNVVEQVSMPNPAAGTWHISVKATTLGNPRYAQTYSLAVTAE